MNDIIILLKLFNLPHFSYNTTINGVQFRFTFQANTRTQSYFLTVELYDGTVVINNKEIVAGRRLFTNTNSPFTVSFTLTQRKSGDFTNLADNYIFSAYY